MIILRSLFWVTWGLPRFVSATKGSHTWEAYSMGDLTNCLNAIIRRGFLFCKLLDARILRVFSFLSADPIMFFMWGVKVR